MQVLIIDIEKGILFKGNVTSLQVPGIDGNYQILNNHAKMLYLLTIGIIELHTLEQNKTIKFTVDNSGLLQVNNNHTKILLN